jgi:N-acetylglucosamine malate deacetylase 2
MPLESLLSGVPVLVVAAHPDDETIGAAGILGHMSDPVVLHVTDGSPLNSEFAHWAGFSSREAYAAARRNELSRALELAGIPEARRFALGFPDQGVSYDLVGLTHAMSQVLLELRPEAVLGHPYEGGHPDHDATAFALHAACRRMHRAPRIFEFPSYHAAGPADSSLESGRFLPGQDAGEVFVLSARDRRRKEAMMACFESQAEVLRNFQCVEERFREAPAYNFERPPHAGRLFYETFPSGISPAKWLALAASALRELEVPALP